MQLPVLTRHADCTSCDLHQGAKSVGMATFALHSNGKPRALFILGKAPAALEDREGRPLVGENGRWLSEWYVKGMSLQEHADIYVQNAVRCRLPNPKMSVPLTSRRACKQWWEDDLRELDKHYEEVVVLCLGAEAVAAAYGSNEPLATLKQGAKLTLGGKLRSVFATYLPTYVVDDPAKMIAVEDHLRMCMEYLRDGSLSVDFKLTASDVNTTLRIPRNVDLVSVDIESYGAFEGMPDQRFFQPQKCLRLDGCSERELAVTAACAWYENGELKHRFYNLYNPEHEKHFIEDVLQHPGRWVLGQNVQFDVQMIRRKYEAARKNWSPFGDTKLIELMVMNFLDSDQRPERGLKPTSAILGTTEYEEEELILKHHRKFRGPDDPDLAVYNVRDAVATLLNYWKFQQRIAEKYGSSTNKGKPECLNWYSDLCWLAISMSEKGIKYNVNKLRFTHDKVEGRLNRLEDAALVRFGVTLRREGATGRAATWLEIVDRARSKLPKTSRGRASRSKRIRELVHSLEGLPTSRLLKATPSQCAAWAVLGCIQKYGLAGDKRLKKTTITEEYSTGLENLNLCLGVAQGEDRRLLKTMRRFHEQVKLLSVLRPMLGTKENPTRKDLNNGLIDGFTYPSWRIVPSIDDAGDSGGTQQGRITPTGRAVQTDPPAVEFCEMSRWEMGAIMRFDEAQVELRVPVMYSRESHMRDLFAAGGSPHELTASLMFGRPIYKKQHPREYQLGKTGGLAVQFRAGAKKLQETARRDNGFDQPLKFWEGIIRTLFSNRAGLIKTQDEWLKRAQEYGYLEIPVLGISRTFLGNVPDTYTPTVVNFPIQTLAAVLTLDAQIAAEKWLRSNGYRTVLIKNTYDEGVYDVPPDEIEVMRAELPKFYRNPPILKVLYEKCGMFEVPLDCSVQISYNVPPRKEAA